MTVEYHEVKDEKGNVVAAEYEISMPPGYKNIIRYFKENYKPLICDECKYEICMVDACDLNGSDFRCFTCFNKHKGDSWEEEH